MNDSKMKVDPKGKTPTPKAKYDYLFKTIVCGDSFVGKTSIIQNYNGRKFDKNFISTLGLDFIVKEILIGDKVIRSQIWDTAGQDRFKSVQGVFLRNCQAIVFVFDLTSKESFDDIEKQYKQAQSEIKTTNYPNSRSKQSSNEGGDDTVDSFRGVKLALVGNKFDCEQKIRSVTHAEAAQYAAERKMLYIETSAKSGQNVKNLFLDLTAEILKDKEVAEQCSYEAMMRKIGDKPKKNAFPSPAQLKNKFSNMQNDIFEGEKQEGKRCC
ncbi:MAG: hypothetical protein MHMPM18_002433 [Marteilia pararefringens]